MNAIVAMSIFSIIIACVAFFLALPALPSARLSQIFGPLNNIYNGNTLLSAQGELALK
jgi:hypothetical protein